MISSVWLHGHAIMENVKFKNKIKLLNDGHNYNIKPNPKGQETDRNLVRCSQIKVLAAQNMEGREQTIAVNIKVSGVQRKKKNTNINFSGIISYLVFSAFLFLSFSYFFLRNHSERERLRIKEITKY
jgi:hypothetical protein